MSSRKRKKKGGECVARVDGGDEIYDNVRPGAKCGFDLDK